MRDQAVFRPLHFFTILFLIVYNATPLLAQPQSGEALTRAAIIGYASNIDAFPYYRVRFKKVFGVADSEADAKVGKGTVKKTLEALCVVDGDRELIEVFGRAKPSPPTAADTARGKGGVTYVDEKEPLNEKMFRKGRMTADYGAGADVLTLFRTDDGRSTPPVTETPSPLSTWYGDQGVRGPDKMLATAERHTVVFLGEKPGGSGLVGVRFTEVAHNHSYESWFAPQKGYLPVELIETSRGSSRGAILEAKEFRPGRWFPMRRIGWGQEPSGKWAFAETVVLELEVDKRPTKEDFSTVVPSGAQVHGLEITDGLYYLKQDERVTPDDLPELFEKLEKSKTDKRMDTGVEHKADRPAWWVWATAVGGVVLIVGGGFLWWRKRRRARRASP